MAAFDPVAAGGVPFNPAAQGGVPTGAGGFAPVTPNPATPGVASFPSFVGPSAASAAAMTAAGAHSAGQFAQVATDATTASEQAAILSNMQNDLAQFTTGSQAERTLGWKKFIQSWAPSIASSFGIDPAKVASQESFSKLANQLVAAAQPGSDARQGVILGATPNADYSPQGVDFIMRQLQGMNDYKTARGNLAAAAPERAQGDYPKFQSRASSVLNPQAFQFARMAPDQQASFYNAIPAGQRPAFQTQFNDTWKNGFYGVNNGMPPHPGP